MVFLSYAVFANMPDVRLGKKGELITIRDIRIYENFFSFGFFIVNTQVCFITFNIVVLHSNSANYEMEPRTKLYFEVFFL